MARPNPYDRNISLDDDEILPAEWHDEPGEANQSPSSPGYAVKKLYTIYRRIYETQISGVASNYTPPDEFDGRAGASLEDKSTKNLWLKLSTDMDTLKVSPEEYIPQIFTIVVTAGHAAPRPQQLLSSKYFNLFMKANADKARQLEGSLKTQMSIASSRIISLRNYLRTIYPLDTTDEKLLLITIGSVAANESLELTPLFRLCLASNVSKRTKHLNAVVERCFPSAFVEYTTWKAYYDKAWKDQLPADFKERVKSSSVRLR